MKVAVTGGSGVVGRSLVRHLVDDGHEVRALARSDRAGIRLESLGAVAMGGDLTDPHSLRNLVSGSSHVFNVAGVNELCTKDPARMWSVNVDGALAVLEACEAEGAVRLIQTSSAVTLGGNGDENTRHRGHFLSEYERSKTVAERLLFNRDSAVEVISVNPSSVQGPGRATGTGKLLLTAARGKTRVAVDATFSIVDIDDCSAGHLMAATRGDPGSRYVLSGATTTVRELLQLMNEVTGHKRRPYFLTREAIAGLARVVDVAPGGIGGLCSESVRVLREAHHYDGNKAVTELGLRYTPLIETVEKTVTWFRDEGLL